MASIESITLDWRGAELVSLIAEGKERLWQGDPHFWSRHAPVLFPIVGRLANDTLRIDGVEYLMKQHGFARDKNFYMSDYHEFLPYGDRVVITPSSNMMSMILVSEKPLPNYPYRFKLTVHYIIEDYKLQCSWVVENCDEKTMHFQIGAHPAFNLPDYNESDEIHGFIQCYDGQGNVVKPMVINHLVDGLRCSYGIPKTLVNDDAVIALTNTTFADDAILLEGNQIASAALFDKNGRKVLTVTCPQADAFGIWAPSKPGCPFVCIEPWCGIADRYNFNGDISERDCNHSLAPGESFEFCYSLTI